MCRRYGAEVARLDVEWGRACDPESVRRALQQSAADIVTIVHAETSTGVLNPVADVAAIAREHGALVIVDAVTSLGAMPLDVAGWQLDVVYSCSQKGLGAPSGVAPIVFAPAALERRVPCRSFAFDLTLLEDYWLRRKYHHTMCASLIYSLREALMVVEEEGLRRALGSPRAPSSRPRPVASTSWASHCCRPPGSVCGRSTLCACLMASTRRRCARFLLEHFNMEIGAGLGPLAGKIWRIGLMGTSSTEALVTLCLSRARTGACDWQTSSATRHRAPEDTAAAKTGCPRSAEDTVPPHETRRRRRGRVYVSSLVHPAGVFSRSSVDGTSVAPHV